MPSKLTNERDSVTGRAKPRSSAKKPRQLLGWLWLIQRDLISCSLQ